MAFKMKGLGSLMGNRSEPVKQEKKNLIDLNPIANHASEGDGPAKKTRAERQSARDTKKTERRAERADKRVKRNEAKVAKLEDKVKKGKEIYNVDEAGNKTTGRKADRIAKAKKKIETNKKISKKGKDLKKSKGEKKAKEVKVKTKKADLLTIRQQEAKGKTDKKEKALINNKFEGGKMSATEALKSKNKEVDLVSKSKK